MAVSVGSISRGSFNAAGAFAPQGGTNSRPRSAACDVRTASTNHAASSATSLAALNHRNAGSPVCKASRIVPETVTPLVLREVGSETRQVFETTMRLRGLDVLPLLEFGSTIALKSAVDSHAGPGILSRLAVQSEVRDGRLAVVTLDDISFKRSIRLVWSKERSLSVPAEQLVQLIEESSTRGRQL